MRAFENYVYTYSTVPNIFHLGKTHNFYPTITALNEKIPATTTTKITTYFFCFIGKAFVAL